MQKREHARDVIASLCVFVMRGIIKPFDVLFISSKDDASGVVVPKPAEPLKGKVFVCSNDVFETEILMNANNDR